MKSPRPTRAAAAALFAVAAALLVAAVVGCGGSDSSTTTSSDIEGVKADSCSGVEYGGEGTPAGLIVSDLPMQGDSAERSRQQVDAIRLVLDRNDWTASDTAVAFQVCDDSIASTGLWDAKTCRSNAGAYADDDL